MKATKDAALKKLKELDLSSLGTQDTLEKYLLEEFRELDLSKKWDSLPQGKDLPNPNNILLYYLLGTHKIPSELNHKFVDADSPDVDVDFEPSKREAIKEYLRSKYGQRNCYEVSTFGGMHVKSAIQDLSRIQGINPQEVFAATTSIDYNVSNDEENSLEYIVENNQKVREFLVKYPKVAEWVEKMQEVKRGVGKHASAFIVASVPIDEYIPVILSKEKEPITGYQESSATKALQSVGLVKLDLLGLENLTVIRETIEAVEQNHGVKIDWHNISLNEPQSYKTINNGYTNGIFQLESSVAAMVIDEVKPTNFDDLSAINSLIRPACLQNNAHKIYAKHKKGDYDRVEYPVWKDLEGKISKFTFDMLNSTYGVIVYQEQTMAMLAEFCGINFDETNKMRKIIGIPANKMTKEHHEYIKSQKDKWMSFGGTKFGLALAEQWWDTAVGSLSYGFNKSHCYSYSITSFRQLWLKTHYPNEFYAALLRSVKAESDKNGRSKLMKYIVEARQMNVQIEAPHVNHSKQELQFNKEVGKIFIGFSQMKGVGYAAASDIVSRGPYTDFDDFLSKHIKTEVRSAVNKTAIEALIYANAFRDFGDRPTLLEKYWRSLLPKKRKDDPIEMPTEFDILREEQDTLTIVLSKQRAISLPYGYISLTKAIDTLKDKTCKIKGILESVTWGKSRGGNKFAKLIINDMENTVTVLGWANKEKKISQLQKEDIVSLSVKHLDNETFSVLDILQVER